MIKVGVVGLGAMGQNHVRVYSELDCRLVGLVDVDQARAQKLAQEFGVKYYSDYRDLIGEVDAVSIVVPTSVHSTIACEFLKNGIHCLVEKPIASSVTEAIAMAEAARHAKVKLMVGHIERFNPAILKLKEMIDQGELGRIILVSTRRVGPFVARIRDVNIILDSAIHDLDIIRSLINRDPISIYSKSNADAAGTKDCALIVMDFDSAIGCVEVNWLTPIKSRTLIATGTDATCHLDYIKQEIQVHNRSGTHQVNVTKGESLKIEIQHFLNCIENNLTPAVNAEAATKALELALLASAIDGQSVCVAERTPGT